jgi:hypothetical protein
MTTKEQQALNELKDICDNNSDDIEYLHWKADDLLCRLLEADYPELVSQFKALPKWYA